MTYTEPHRAPADIVNGLLTYVLRKGLTLRPEHLKRMRVGRGLSGEWIYSQVYRSTPSSEAERDRVADLAAPYLEAFGGGVPGFYHDGRRWRIVYCAPGILISSRDEYGRI